MNSFGLSSLAAQDSLVFHVRLGSYGSPWSPYIPARPGTQQVGYYYSQAQVGLPHWSPSTFFRLEKNALYIKKSPIQKKKF